MGNQTINFVLELLAPGRPIQDAGVKQNHQNKKIPAEPLADVVCNMAACIMRNQEMKHQK